jgi:small basic protein
MASAMKASLQAAMGTTIRNCFALFLEPGDHSFYLNDMLTLTDAQAPGGLPAQTLLEETMAYVTPRLRWNGRTVIFTFSMGGQIWRKVIEWQSLYGLRGIHFTSAPRLNYSSGGPFNGSTAAEFREVWGEDPDNPFPADPVSNARYIANSPQKIVEVNSAAIVSAIAAGTFGLRASVGADDNTKIGHHAFIDNVLTPAGIACASPADYVGVDHNLALVLAADATAIYAFLESRL